MPMPTKNGSNQVKHTNAVDNGKKIKLPSETVYELGHVVGRIKSTPEGVGMAFALIHNSEPHFHPKATEYYFVTDGKGVLLLDDKEIHLNPHDVLVIPNGITHAVKSDGGLRVFVLSSPPWRKEDHILRELKNLRR